MQITAMTLGSRISFLVLLIVVSKAAGRRRDIEALSPAELLEYREKIRAAQESGAWATITGWHGMPYQGSMRGCPHGNGKFLPWHRFYLKRMEETIGTSLHWWNWNKGMLPAAFADKTYVDKQGKTRPNPLLCSTIPTNAQNSISGNETHRVPDSPFPSIDLIEKANLAVWGSDNVTSMCKNMELMHNLAHGSVGGSMNDLDYASYDPIFWSLHLNTDRRWLQWQLLHDENTDYPEEAKGILEIHDERAMGSDMIKDFSGWTEGYPDAQGLIKALRAYMLRAKQVRELVTKPAFTTLSVYSDGEESGPSAPATSFAMVRATDGSTKNADAMSIMLMPDVEVSTPEPTMILSSGGGQAKLVLQGPGLSPLLPGANPAETFAPLAQYKNQSTTPPAKRPAVPRVVMAQTSAKLSGDKNPRAISVMLAPNTTMKTPEYVITNKVGGLTKPLPRSEGIKEPLFAPDDPCTSPPIEDHVLMTLDNVQSTKEPLWIEAVIAGRVVGRVFLFGMGSSPSMKYRMDRIIDLTRAWERLDLAHANKTMEEMAAMTTFRLINARTNRQMVAPRFKRKIVKKCF